MDRFELVLFNALRFRNSSGALPVARVPEQRDEILSVDVR